MIDPVHDRRPPISPQLAMRVAIMGVFAFVLFGIVFFRLWYLQVLSGDQYRQEANNNRIRVTRVQAPRGDIVDRNGDVLVENRVATVVQMNPESLPALERSQVAAWGQQMTTYARLLKARDHRKKGHKGHRPKRPPMPLPATPELRGQLERLGGALGMSPRTIQHRIVESLVLASYANITIKVDVPASVRNYLLERPEQFPGVQVQKTYLRRYPEGELAAQLVGNVGEISPAELKLKRFRGVHPGTIVGQQGIEHTYDRYLRGIDGQTRISVDALGHPKNQYTARDPTSGRTVRLTLDLGLQKAGDQAFHKAMAAGGTAGAFVALDPRNGAILATGSYPSFDPSVLARPISQSRYDQLFGAAADHPQFNRAIAGAYPTGSAFKPITALAALSTGSITPSTPIDDTGCITVGTAGQRFCNSGQKANGSVSLVRALQVSSDVFFYTLGTYLDPLSGQPLQKWAHKLGLGQTTGIDIPGEFHGTVPDRKWRDERNALETACRKKHHIPLSAGPGQGCGIADGSNRPWTIGDEVNLAVGQGDLQATPLQMAVAYSALENGGRVVRPHLGEAIEDQGGRELQRIDSGTSKRVKIDPTYLAAIRDGLHLAASAPGGTSADVFSGWDQKDFPVYGKTGTAQRNGSLDQSWYVCFVPNGSRPIAIAVTVENGGWGAQSAAPIARWMLGQWFHQKKVFKPGASFTK